jgi:CBS domain-containing protein
MRVRRDDASPTSVAKEHFAPSPARDRDAVITCMTAVVVHLHSPVSVLVQKPAPRISPETTITGASQVMRSRACSALLVGRGPGAIVTERDLARALAAEYPADLPVGDIASPLPVRVPGTEDVLSAAAVMLNEEIRHLVVDLPDGGQGVVSLRQIMAVLLQAAQPEPWLAALRVRVDLPEMWLG